MTDDTALVTVLDRIIPMINKLSKKNSEIEEDLKSILVTYSIELIRKNKFIKFFKFVVPLFKISSAIQVREENKNLSNYGLHIEN